MRLPALATVRTDVRDALERAHGREVTALGLLLGRLADPAFAARLFDQFAVPLAAATPTLRGVSRDAERVGADPERAIAERLDARENPTLCSAVRDELSGAVIALLGALIREERRTRRR